MICDSRKLTETEARSTLSDASWTIDKEEIYRMLVIIYVEGSSKSRPFFFLTVKSFGTSFFSQKQCRETDSKKFFYSYDLISNSVEVNEQREIFSLL